MLPAFDERLQLLALIDELYPADSEKIYTRTLGRSLFKEACANNWRTAPLEILREYHRLCEEERERTRPRASDVADHEAWRHANSNHEDPDDA